VAAVRTSDFSKTAAHFSGILDAAFEEKVV